MQSFKEKALRVFRLLLFCYNEMALILTFGEKMTEKTCAQRWKSHKDSRVSDIKELLKAYNEGEESALYKEVEEEIGNIHGYGLSFDYVRPETYENQLEGYWRYQISYGGPSEEFRFYASTPTSKCYRIEFVFLDWGDGCVRSLKGKDLEIMEDWWSFVVECETPGYLFDKEVNDE